MPCTEAYKEHIMYTFHGYAAIENGHVNLDDSIKSRLVAALCKFRFDEREV